MPWSQRERQGSWNCPRMGLTETRIVTGIQNRSFRWCSRRFYRQFCVLLHTFSGPFLHKGFWTERFARRLSHRYHTRGSGLSQSTARKHWSAPNAVQSLPSSTCVSAHPSQSCFTHAEVGIQQKDRRCIRSFDFRSSTTTNGTTGICLYQNCGSKSSTSMEVSQ